MFLRLLSCPGFDNPGLGKAIRLVEPARQDLRQRNPALKRRPPPLHKIILLALLAIYGWTGGQSLRADTSIGTVAAGSEPRAAAVNPATNKIYIANYTGAS